MLKVRKNNYHVEISVIDDPVDLEKLVIILDTYIKSSYLESFGYHQFN